jgi:hypothetical protein
VAIHEDQGKKEHGLCTLNYAEKLSGRTTSTRCFSKLVRPARFERATFRFGVVADHSAHVLPNTPYFVFQRLSGP